MQPRNKWYKRLLSIGLCLAMLIGSLGIPDIPGVPTSDSTVQAAESSAQLSRDSIHDGAILHAFCWNFNTIKANMKAIADAGFTAVQTSPINECLKTHPELQIHGDGMWYYHYQPTDWVIGNYQLGTRDEFAAMCEEAHKYGIGVIVDILPNHTTPSKDEVSENLVKAGGGWDTLLHKSISNTSGRLGTTYTYSGLLDVDTENTGFQQYFYEFLKDCLKCGADGFRIDTAKHIALPDDPVPDEYEDKNRNQFYPNMKKAIDDNSKSTSGAKSFSELFVYGETLQGNERTAAYQDMLGGTTASNYGASIRTALSSRDFTVSKISGYEIDDEKKADGTIAYAADSNKLVTWVESHDNYCNDGEDSWKIINDEDVRLGYAIIGARKDGTPLFFSRPMNSSADNPWGDNILGAAGNNEYKSAEVTAVNKFRTAMAGKGERLTNPGDNVQVLMIERGTSVDTTAEGAVIVNGSSSEVALDSITKLADGTYVNKVDGKTLFTVKGGVLNGTLPERSVVVLQEKSDQDATTVFFYNSDRWDTVKADVTFLSESSASSNAASGNAASGNAASGNAASGNAVARKETYDTTNNADGWWSVTVPAATFSVAFTDGGNKQSAAFTITPSTGRYMTGIGDVIYADKAKAEAGIGVQVVSVYFFNTENWDSVNAYAFKGEGESSTNLLGGWPGSPIAYDGAFWYRADVKFIGVEDFTIIFNNNGKQTEDIGIKASELVKGTDGSLNAYVALDQVQGGDKLKVKKDYTTMDAAEDAWGVSGRRNFTTVYFYNADGWDKVGAYTWEAVSLGNWPGMLMDDDGDGWYKLQIKAVPGANFNLIFNNYVGDDDTTSTKLQTGNLLVSDIKNRYFVGKAGKSYASKAEALEALANTPEEPVVEMSRVFYYDEKSWGSANLYIWSDNAEYQNCLGGWPGAGMTAGPR